MHELTGALDYGEVYENDTPAGAKVPISGIAGPSVPDLDRSALHDGLVTEITEPWATPVPLARPVAPFPLGGCVGSVSDFVDQLAEETQTPVDLAGVFALAVLGAAVGGHVDVNPVGNWVEPTNIYTACALPPGQMKSAVVARTGAPLVDHEQSGVAESVAAREEAKARQAIAIARAKDAEKAAVKAEPADREKAEADAAQLAVDAARVTVPGIARMLADDATPEALTTLLAENGGRLAVLSSEGGVFDLMAGRYTTGANLDVYLKGWSGDTIQIDRKGRAPEFIASPALTIGLAVQPFVLREIARQPGFRGRGITSRFLWSMPDSRLGSRNVRDPRPMAQATLREWRGLVTTMAATFGALKEPVTLLLSPEAKELFIGYREQLEPRLAEHGDLAHITDIGGKMHGQVIRLAAIEHLASYIETGWGEPIGLASMERALLLADYFTDHALAVFDFMAARGGLDDAETVLRWIASRRTEINKVGWFTQRECHRANLRRFPHVDSLVAVLTMLEEYGYVRALPKESAEQGGRPSIRFEAHPDLLTEPTQPHRARGCVGFVNTQAAP